MLETVEIVPLEAISGVPAEGKECSVPGCSDRATRTVVVCYDGEPEYGMDFCEVSHREFVEIMGEGI